MRRTAARVDGNHVLIVETLRSLGFSVLSLASIGNGCPDLLIARNGRCGLVEIKDGNQPPSKTVLTHYQTEFHATWKSKIAVLYSKLDAIELAENWKP